MRIPSRGEVLAWNENQVADLVREHQLLDCVDCVYQRHIDGQKLLNLKEGDVLYFLEIHNEKSREKFWSLIQKIAEKKSGVQDLMGKFQQPNGRKVSEVEQSEDWSSDDFSGSDFESESDCYDVPDPDEIHPESKEETAIPLDRQETIRKNLERLMGAKRSPSPEVAENPEDYPDNEDIYDVPEDGCGEPEQDVYETPSDESGGGVVGRKSSVQRQQSEQYIVPNQVENASDDELQYEDLSGTPAVEQEDYVVPDMNPAAVPPLPPKPGDSPARPLTPDSADEYIEPDSPGMDSYEPPSRVTKKPEQKKPVIEQAQENYEPPRPPTKTKKSPVIPGQKNAEPQRFPFKNKKPEVIPPQENYEPPRPPSKTKKSPVISGKKNVEPPRFPFKSTKPEVIPPQENYEPPRAPSKMKPEVVPPQENYELPQPPSKTKKSPVIPQQKNAEPRRFPFKSKKAEVIPPQENYEPPRPPSKMKPEVVPPQENYEPPQPPSKTKKSPVIPQQKNKEPHRFLLNKSKKPEVIPPQENYEPPRAPSKMKKPEVVPPQENYELPQPPSKIKPVTPEQENYEPPQPPSKHIPFFPGKKITIPENKKPFLPERKKPVIEEQENYEPLEPIRKNKISAVKQQERRNSLQPPPNPETFDIEEPEDVYEPVSCQDNRSANGDEDMEVQENYEIPLTEPEPVKPTPRHLPFNPRNLFNKRDSNKKLTPKQPAKPAHPPKSPTPNLPKEPNNGFPNPNSRQLPPKPSSSPKNTKVLPPTKVESKTVQNRQSLALPSLPARKEPPAKKETQDHVDSRASASLRPLSREMKKPEVVPPQENYELPQPPSKIKSVTPEQENYEPPQPPSKHRPFFPGKKISIPENKKPILPERNPPVIEEQENYEPLQPVRMSTSKSLGKSKEQLLREQPWFHGSIKKEVYSNMLKNAKKDGAFLVRNSSRDTSNYITSISFNSNIIHLNMPCDQGMYKLGDSGKLKFSSIIELIEHFKKNPVEFAFGGSTSLKTI